MKPIKSTIAAAAIWLAAAPGGAQAQGTVPGQYLTPVGYCQIGSSALGSAVKLSSCTWASFTGTGSGTSLTVTSVTGIVAVGETVSGSGVPSGTTITGQVSAAVGAPANGGAGVYTTSQATTSNAASLTTTGLPTGQLTATLQAETANVRYRDDGVAPTASSGGLVVNGVLPWLYSGNVSGIQFIAASGSPVLDAFLYRSGL